MVFDPSAGDTHFHQLKDESGCKKAKKNCRITSICSHPRLPFTFLSFFPLWKQLDMAVWMEGTECSRGTGFSSIGLPWSGCHVWQKVKVAGNPWRCLSFRNSEAVLSYLGEILVSWFLLVLHYSSFFCVFLYPCRILVNSSFIKLPSLKVPSVSC